MTNQSAQASQGAVQAAQCLTAGLSLLVLVLSALLLNVLAAVFVCAAAVALFLLIRPLNDRGRRRSRELFPGADGFASGVGEATRLAEETYVFGVAEAQRSGIEHLVASARDLFFRRKRLVTSSPICIAVLSTF